MYERADLEKLLEHLEQQPPEILVVGDVMLDRYTWGNASRVSPEAPVVVLHSQQHEARLGGAASVAYLLACLGVKVAIAGVVGEDAEGTTVARLLQEAGVEAGGLLVVDPQRPTTCKERILGWAGGRHPQQLVRVDRESATPLDDEDARELAAGIGSVLATKKAVLLSDYGKGACTPTLVETLIAECQRQQVPLLVDPARGAAGHKYRGASLLKPNRDEAQELAGMNRPIFTPAAAIQAGLDIRKGAQVAAVAVTLDRDGIVVADGDEAAHFPTVSRDVYDITGAGDMALAAFGVAAACQVTLADGARLANLAAGLEVQRWGVTGVTVRELRAALGVGRSTGKIVSLEELEQHIAQRRRLGQRIVFTNGCFDLLHAGHVACLEDAAQLGDVLVVALNSDESIKRLKGTGRPIVPQAQRACLIAALACTDYVIVFGDDTPHVLLRALRPDILVKGGTYGADEVVGSDVVAAYGGRSVVVSRVDGVSSTSLIEAISRQRVADARSTSLGQDMIGSRRSEARHD